MPFTPPDFYWKDALLGISCELLLCSLIWFEEAMLLSGFQSTYLRNTQFFLEQVSIFLHSEEFRSIVLGNLTVHVMFFLVSPFRSRLETTTAGRNKGGWGVASATAVQMRLRIPKKITTGLLHCRPGLVLMPHVPSLFERNLSSGCMKNVLARQSSWLLIWNEDQKASSNHLLSTADTLRLCVTHPAG